MRDRQRRAVARHGSEATEIAKRLRSLHSGSGHNLRTLWTDWVSAMALALANACDKRPATWRAREDEYMQIVGRHGSETMHAFAAMMGIVLQALEAEPFDLLGAVYMALEMGNDDAGQFFTPSSLCELMSRLLVGEDDLRQAVEREGWITVHEPAIGGGATVIAMAARLLELGLSPAAHLHVVGVDVDSSVLRMAYVQLAMLGVPAVLYVGNTLTMEMRGDWYTPAHILCGWGPRLRRCEAAVSVDQPHVISEGPERAQVCASAQLDIFGGLGVS